MSIQPKCVECQREGGYTSDVASDLCERCIVRETPKKKRKANNDDE